jgi:hypothetical protein
MPTFVSLFTPQYARGSSAVPGLEHIDKRLQGSCGMPYGQYDGLRFLLQNHAPLDLERVHFSFLGALVWHGFSSRSEAL